MSNKTVEGAKFHHIALRAKDFEKSKQFYTKGLGFEPCAQWGTPEKTICMLEMGDGGRIELFNGGADGLPEDFETRGGAYFHLAIGVDDPDAAYSRALEYGAAPRTEPKDAVIPADPPMNVRLAFVTGPDGEIIEFFHEKS